MKIKSCKDYETLKENLKLAQLEFIENKINHYENYKLKNDDGKKDIIGEYISLYGTGIYTIDWYEGLMDTDEFIEEMKGV